ncbi:BFD-like [2Fe-2S] binding domain-containing protein [Marinitoga hydrogenitolerans DSM 16785]|uniref:BFD-like [2Fe-2S] binding domain-containing protein n=1 Tax=Marinitoga hydrogenitolerans (strain DSM 16785 / JCM 12826 / AT1271) TaxID=1122195 RepID=A0A1M5AMS8_MARH1|nr:(2Fe-2S)-binding protein [Marinitoga hydrogenitolerans]SHF31568.1 BFD-like [2Fe-2S] binding domain-containing protein [Marinitoga hydrogenitolerans DSM 16785]
MDEDKIIVCRCEDITLREIKDLIKQGFTTVEEIKRISRAGMGPCQGKTCGPIIAREISKFTGKPIEEVYNLHNRPPFGGIFFKEIVGGKYEK